MTMKKLTRKSSENGFTIIELLIATLVFSAVLLLITYGIIQITRTYYKGITSTKTQQTTRAVIDEISQSIQFAGGTVSPSPSPVPGSSQVFCLNTKRYSYILGRKLIDESNHVLVTDTPPCTGTSPAQDMNTTSLTNDSRELLAPNMRLSKLEVTEVDSSTGLWKVTVKVVYGEDDLLCSPSVDDCLSNVPSTNLGNPDLICKTIRSGTQFCAVSELSTIVQKRLD